jgi:hypothetical protein
MTGRARTIVAVGSLFAALASAAAAIAQTPGSSLKDQLVGHWQLVSVSINNTTPYGANPQGSMMLDAGGHYSVIVISDGGAKNISYFGSYTVDDAAKTMIMHIDGSTHTSTDGRDQKRFVTLSGDQLIQDTLAGRRGSVRLTWKRAN